MLIRHARDAVEQPLVLGALLLHAQGQLPTPAVPVPSPAPAPTPAEARSHLPALGRATARPTAAPAAFPSRGTRACQPYTRWGSTPTTCTPCANRSVRAVASVARVVLQEHVGIEVHLGKTRIWNLAGEEPAGGSALEGPGGADI